MKKLLLLTLALALGACTAAPTQAPAAALPEASQTPVVVVQTVVVEATQVPTEVIPPTAVPPVVVTVVVQPTQDTSVVQPPAASTDTGAAPIMLDNILGKGVFSNITLSGSEFTLRCVTRELTITATASLIDIEEAELFYRVRDYPQALYDSPWRSAGKMDEVSSGVFSMVLTGETVNPDSRLDPGWFDFQLVGLNKGGGVVDRTQKIEQLVVYRINCP